MFIVIKVTKESFLLFGRGLIYFLCHFYECAGRESNPGNLLSSNNIALLEGKYHTVRSPARYKYKKLVVLKVYHLKKCGKKEELCPRQDLNLRPSG